MLRKIANWLILLPLAAVLLIFALANRHLVTLSFDPFSADPALGLSLPLFAVILLAAIAGVIGGGIATWFGQRRWRRAARRSQAESRDLRAELQRQREAVPAAAPATSREPPRMISAR